MSEYKIARITDLQGKPRVDGRYPQRINRFVKEPAYKTGTPMFIEYLRESDGSDYSNKILRTSMIEKFMRSEDGSFIIVKTKNSIYRFELVE